VSVIEAEKFRSAVRRKLAAEGIDCADIEGACFVLSKCVMGSKLVKAYTVLTIEG
jgi:hypothetical protein